MGRGVEGIVTRVEVKGGGRFSAGCDSGHRWEANPDGGECRGKAEESGAWRESSPW